MINVRNLAASKVTAQEVNAQIASFGFATVTQLNAVNARFDNYQARIGQNTFLTAGGLTVTGYCRVGGYDLSTYIGRIRSAVNALYSQQGANPPL